MTKVDRVLIALSVVVVIALGFGVIQLQRFKAAMKIVFVDPGSTGRRINERGVFANYFPGADRAPGLLLLGGSEGGLGEGSKRVALELQRLGYSVLTPSYFGAPGQPTHLERVPLETFDRALVWLKGQPEVDPDRIALGGVSKGAEAALLIATRHPELRAVVVGVPSSVVWPGIKLGLLNVDSSWTLHGRPLPDLPYGPMKLQILLGDIGVVYRDGIKKVGQHPDAVIPVEKIRAPILAMCGKADKLWPSCVMTRQIEERGHNVTVLAYDDAGHASIGPPLAKNDPDYRQLGRLGGSIEGNNRARADGWPKLLEFLRTNLR